MRRYPVIFFLVLVACGGAPWSAPGAPKAPPDEQFRTGVEAGEDVYVWSCYQNERVMVSQFSGCFGSRAPVLERGPCGKALPSESRFGEPRQGGTRGRAVPESQRWPGSDAGARE